MKFYSTRKNYFQQSGVEGLLLMLTAVPFVFLQTAAGLWQSIAAGLSTVICLAAAWYMLRRPDFGKLLAGIAATTCVIALWPDIKGHPATALFAAVVYIFALYSLSNFSSSLHLNRSSDEVELGLQRTRWAALSLIGISVASFLIVRKPLPASATALLVISAIAQLLSILWSIYQQSNFHKLFCILLNTLTFLAAFYMVDYELTWLGCLIIGATLLLFLPKSAYIDESQGNWWDIFVNHPGRATLATFLLLCLSGTFLLFLPGAAAARPIALIDAAFTAVSAVCITGLIVLDTPNDFSLLGQVFILLLIQLGGLGIMTVTTVAMHAFGRRLSLKQAKVLKSTFNSEHDNLVSSLIQIIKFTAACEISGAIILTVLFYHAGFAVSDAFWRGIFTSISAFCNAGFALQTDSLIPFQSNPLILHCVATLIMVGGLAPAVVLIIPEWLRGGSVSVAAKMALVTTAALLFIGTLFFLVFEWNSALGGLSTANKFHNAWFQSVTLRTAGFNSVAIEHVLGPTFLIMICLMFIGGSPGGTAGGIKTTTIGVLIATFWACALGYDEITIKNKRVIPETVFKAVTTVVAGMFILLAIVLMLEATQQIGSRALIFEATSALGTVGLSLGATANLDAIGKIIIMLAMFAGRIGPVTLFTLLSRERSSNAQHCLDARINLT
ncbi:MAG: potassium transporter TrkH [Candidatus Riflebacteria bacterium HGW-Riflebacteria-1]|jgi:trk system potassium uptake protein TrkH|nr:MAG: potassium transporter TrkH [Candidatus Riflebacteria bacterium HGW-Riflebacteria-1]